MLGYDLGYYLVYGYLWVLCFDVVLGRGDRELFIVFLWGLYMRFVFFLGVGFGFACWLG